MAHGLHASWHVGTSGTRNRTCVLCIGSGFLPTVPPGQSINLVLIDNINMCSLGSCQKCVSSNYLLPNANQWIRGKKKKKKFSYSCEKVMQSTPCSVSLVLKLHKGLLKPRFPGPSLRVSDSVSDSGRTSKICVSNKFSGDILMPQGYTVRKTSLNNLKFINRLCLKQRDTYLYQTVL